MTKEQLFVPALATLALLAGCRAEPAPETAAADASYSVRAEIVRLPAAPGGELYLRHESIPAFRSSEGETVGMMSMTMPFGVASGVDVSAFAAGDRVVADFEVRWQQSRRPLLVTRLAPLPEGTGLEFDPEPEAQPSGETPR